MNPFDWRTILFARHAQHVVIIHFPIALFLCGVMFDLLAAWRKSQTMAVAAYYNLAAAAFWVIPAIATGLLAWQLQFGGRTPHGTLRLHLILAVTSGAAIWLVWWLQRRARREVQNKRTRLILGLEIVTALFVAITGHLGGFLSGVNGPR